MNQKTTKLDKQNQHQEENESKVVKKARNRFNNGKENENLNGLYDLPDGSENSLISNLSNPQFFSLELVNVDSELNKLIDKFNKNPKKAIPYLCQYYHHSGNIAPPVIAHIIHTTPGLRNDKILSYFTSSKYKPSQNPKINQNYGEYIENESHEFGKDFKLNRSVSSIDMIHPSAVLKAFFDEMNLKVSLLDAIRTCLDATGFLNCSFDKMDNIIRIFSYSYFDQNKSAIKVSYIYLAALSIILLNNEILRNHKNEENNFENQRKMIPEYYDIIVKHIFPEQYLQFFSTGAVYRRINSKPFSQKIFNPEDIKIHFSCRVEKKTNKWNSIFKKRYLSLNNNRLILYKEKEKMVPTNLLLINSNLIIQAEKDHSKRTFIRSSSFIYKNKKKSDILDYECYNSLTKSAQKRFQNGIVEDFSRVSDISLNTTTDTTSSSVYNSSTMAYSSSSYDFSFESEKGEYLQYAHFSGSNKNSSVYKKNIDELVLRFESVDQCKSCSFVLKKALLLSFFIEDSPLLTIPPAFLDF